jgi:hypothetical protein
MYVYLKSGRVVSDQLIEYILSIEQTYSLHIFSLQANIWVSSTLITDKKQRENDDLSMTS